MEAGLGSREPPRPAASEHHGLDEAGGRRQYPTHRAGPERAVGLRISGRRIGYMRGGLAMGIEHRGSRQPCAPTGACQTGGAHAHAGGGCGGGSCAPETQRTPHAVRHVSCRICMASGGAGWAARRWFCRASPPPPPRTTAAPGSGWRRSCAQGVCGGGSCAPESQRTRHTRCGMCRAAFAWPLGAPAGPRGARSVGHHHSPYARPRPRLVALMLMRAGGGAAAAPVRPRQNARHTRCGMCRAVFAWPLGAPAGPRGARSVVHHHHPTHDHGPGWRRSCAQGSAGAAPVRLRPNAHATRGEGCVVLYSHGLWGRRLGHGGIVGLEPPQASSKGP